MRTPKQPSALVAADHGSHLDLTPTGVLMMAADAAFDPDTSPAGRRNAHELIEKMFHAAVAGGYTQGDILKTLLSQRPIDIRRTVAMVREACVMAGDERIGAIFTAAKLQRKK